MYLPNGCNSDFFVPMDKVECKKKLGLDVNKRYILYVDSNRSRNRTQKRKDRFDATMQLLQEKYGYDNLAELVMVGVPRQDVPTWMNACDLHLLSSDEEGSPNSVKECLFCGVPVVATNVGNVEDLLENMPASYVSGEFTPDSLAEVANRALASNATKVEIRNAVMQKGLDIGSVAKNLYQIYL